MGSRRHLVLNPSNASTSYGYNNQQNTIRFDMGNNGLCVAKDMRLTFDVVFKTAAAGDPDMTNDYNVDPYITYHSLIQTISWSSRNFNESQMERINNYPALAKLIVSAQHSKNDMDTTLFTEQKSVGYGITSNVNQVVGETKCNLSARRNCVGTKQVALKLLCGITLSDPIPLDITQGLTLDITLATPNSALFGTDATNGYYEITNPKLHVPIIIEPDDVIMARQSQPQQSLRFLSYSSIFDTLDTAGVISLNHRLGLKNVLSMMCAFTPTADLNNFARNSLGFYNPAIVSLVFRKNSQQFPLYYTLETNRNTGLQLQQGSTNPQVEWNYLSAHRETKDIKSSSLNPNNLRFGVERNGNSPFAIGCSFDEISGNGVNAQIDNLNLTINADLPNPTAQGTDAQTPYAAFFYYLNINNIIVQTNAGVVQVN